MRAGWLQLQKSQTHREEEEENSISEMKIPLFRDFRSSDNDVVQMGKNIFNGQTPENETNQRLKTRLTIFRAHRHAGILEMASAR